jgi:hypothetical protein
MAATRRPNSGWVLMPHRLHRPLGALHRQLDLPGKAAEFLAQPQRRGIHQVGAADLDHPVPLLGLFAEHLMQPLQGGDQLGAGFDRQGDVDGGGEGVVGALPHVDVIIGMDRLFSGEAVAADQLNRPIRDHLVEIHVAAGSRSRLVDVDGELIGQLPFGHLARGAPQGVDLVVAERILPRAGQFSQVEVGLGGSELHQPHGADHRRR